MDILIVGATSRAAAFSALRAALQPATIDLFADRDLCAAAQTVRLPREHYPDGFAALAAARPYGPWIYTGGLENSPELVERIAGQRPLWGNRGDVLRAIRDPIELAARLRREGLPCPEVRLNRLGLPRDASWLVKPVGSAGGLGIFPLEPDAPEPTRACYYQERIAGPSLPAIFVAHRDRALLRGISLQLVGRPGAGFVYSGSVAPWPVSPAEERRIRLLGETLARSFALVGIFGVDLVLRGGIPWPVEVNPRYTASVEVVERAGLLGTLACAGFAGGRLARTSFIRIRARISV